MRDKSNQLLVVNTGRREPGSNTDNQTTRKTGGSGGGVVGGNQYLLKEIWDKCWEIRTTDKGEEYIFGKLPVAVQFGLTSYVDGGYLDLPSIYDGLVIDNQTIYWEEIKEEAGTDEEGNPIYKTTKVLKAAGGGGTEGGSVNWDDIDGKPDLSQYVTSDALDDALGYYLPLTGGTLKGDLNIDSKWELWVKGDSYFGSSGVCVIREDNTNKRMVISSIYGFDITNNSSYYLNYTGGGIRVNEGLITYNKKDGYWKMEGNLLVTGGITSYSSDGKASPFLVDVEDWSDISSESTTQVYTANATALLKKKLKSTDDNTTAALTKITALKTSLTGLSASNVSELVTALKNIAAKL